MCGEKVAFDSPFTTLLGSPPRVRGKGLTLRLIDADLGITPACAGKSSSCPCPRCRCPDHPRVCGEKAVNGVRVVVGPGSPPRVRGKVRRVSRTHCAVGITPACAGKRGCCMRSSRRPGDHPRVCGEKTKKSP